MSSSVDLTEKCDKDEEKKVTQHIFNMADYSIFTADLSIFHLAHNLTTISNVNDNQHGYSTIILTYVRTDRLAKNCFSRIPLFFLLKMMSVNYKCENTNLAVNHEQDSQ